ncbi:hypothetical protein [Raoultella sp. HC6]|uniref:hypothetical protein n=1 Tax=Raoultella sp. HC6 TaxID=2923366 RepID=UPI001F506440|nr:hypothetical protein [Raoultella sp. HC6]
MSSVTYEITGNNVTAFYQDDDGGEYQGEALLSSFASEIEAMSAASLLAKQNGEQYREEQQKKSLINQQD